MANFLVSRTGLKTLTVVTGVACGAENAYLSGAHDFTSGFDRHSVLFIIYKLPILTHGDAPHMKEGLAFYYMDNTHHPWRLSDVGIHQPGHAVYYTLQQIYKPPENGTYMYAMYNDQPPTVSPSLNHGHTKGVVGFDKTEGFWLVHSTPEFPPVQSNGYSWPNSGKDYGQTFLCVSYSVKMMNRIALQFLYTYPKIYDKTFPEYFDSISANMTSILSEKQPQIQTAPWNHLGQLGSLRGASFLSYAKSKYFGEDLYGAWLTSALKQTLLVETWRKGLKDDNLPSNCSGQYKVMNVEKLAFPDKTASFVQYKDHSKWAVSNTSSWTCIGDINRQKTQFKRGGGTVCFENKAIWKSFHGLIVQYENCTKINYF